MWIGVQTFGNFTKSIFDEQLTREWDYIKCDGMVLDEIICDNNNGEIGFGLDKRQWCETTEFLGRFQNDLECGNIKGINGVAPSHIAFKKRIKGTEDWLCFALEQFVEYETNIYEINDYMAWSGDVYEYAVVPALYNPATGKYKEGEYVINEIQAEYSGVWIVDSEKSVNAIYNADFGTTSHNRIENTLQPLNRRFPIVQRIANVKYDSGQLSFILMSKETAKNLKGVDVLADRKYLDEIMDWMEDNSIKIIKDENTRKNLVHISDVKDEYNQDFMGGLPTVSFNWEEVGDVFSQEDMVEFGFYPEYEVEE